MRAALISSSLMSSAFMVSALMGSVLMYSSLVEPGLVGSEISTSTVLRPDTGRLKESAVAGTFEPEEYFDAPPVPGLEEDEGRVGTTRT